MSIPTLLTKTERPEQSRLGKSTPLSAVSVALATYNGSRFLEEQLESLAKQTHLPAELVVGDDQSTDGTVAILERFAVTVPFPVYTTVNAVRRGYRDNFLATAERCSSPLIAFSDQDDVWLPRKLEVCARQLDRTGALLCVHAATLVSAELRPIEHFAQAIFADTVLPHFSLWPFFTYYGFSQVFRRELLKIIPSDERPEGDLPFGAPISHDRWITFLANMLGEIACVQQPLVLYRQHGDNASGVQKAVRRRDALLRLASPLPAGSNAGHARLCLERAAMLERHVVQHDGPWAEAARLACEHLRLYARHYQGREQLYVERSTARRLAGFARQIRSGAYGEPGGAGFGRNTMIKDALIGLLRIELGKEASS